MNSGLMYAFRPHTPTRLQRKWADETGVPAQEVLPAAGGAPQVGSAPAGRAPTSAFSALEQRAASVGNPALERDLGVEKLRRARIENEALDAQTPMSQDAAIQTGRAGRMADFAAEKGGAAAQATARGTALGQQAGADEALLSPLGAHASAVRHGQAKEIAYNRADAASEAARIRWEGEQLKEQIRQAGLLRMQQERGASAEEQALIRAYAILADTSNQYTPDQRDTAAAAIQQMLQQFSGRR